MKNPPFFEISCICEMLIMYVYPAVCSDSNSDLYLGMGTRFFRSI